jgi:hypothetical protein
LLYHHYHRHHRHTYQGYLLLLRPTLPAPIGLKRQVNNLPSHTLSPPLDDYDNDSCAADMPQVSLFVEAALSLGHVTAAHMVQVGHNVIRARSFLKLLSNTYAYKTMCNL